MEWGTFITVIAAIYLAWYGLNFLYDFFIGSKPKVAADSGVQYNISGLVAEEEPARFVKASDIESEPVEVHQDDTETPHPKPPVAADTPDASDASGPGLSMVSHPEPTPAPQALPTVPEDTEDWAEVATRVADHNQATEEKIDITVQSQPVAVSDFIAALKNQAKTEAAAITF